MGARAPRARRAGRRARDRPAGPARRCMRGARPRPACARDRRGRRLGLDERARARRRRRRTRAAGADRAPLRRPPAPDRRPRADADRQLPAREPRPAARRDGLLLDDPRERPLPHLGVGLHAAGGRRGGRARRDLQRARGRAGGPARRPPRPPRRDRPGLPALRRRHHGRARRGRRAGLPRHLAAGDGAERDRPGDGLPDARRRRAARRAAGAVRLRERDLLRLPPVRRRARNRDPVRRPAHAAQPRRRSRRLPRRLPRQRAVAGAGRGRWR